MPICHLINIDGFVGSLQIVTPAKAGVQKTPERLDSRLRGNDGKKHFPTFCEFINIPAQVMELQTGLRVE